MQSTQDISQPFLTKILAESRSTAIQKNSISYNLGLHLIKGQHLFGCTQITFTLLSFPSIPLSLDYIGQLLSIQVNNTALQPKQDPTSKRIILENLQLGINTVYLQFKSNYSYDRDGCKTVVDSEGRQYLCVCFEPYAANKVFPNFDQPDLKARFTLKIVVEKDWVVTTGTEEEFGLDVKQFGNDKVHGYLSKLNAPIHYYKQTEVLASYLISFIAGEYHHIVRPTSESYKNLPTGLYCQQAMVPTLEKYSPLLFQMIDIGLQFFQSFFGYPYPFKKYQVIFFSNYSVHAMENPGLIVFEDSYLFKEDVGEELMVDLGSTFFHEMAHCWFGDLVTMKWWNDLWLNESFADYMGFYCLEKVKNKIKNFKYQTSMISYFRRKWWGYKEDSYSSNHPVKSIITDTDEAFALFDGITYSKGGSILKNIVFLIGQDKFSQACKEYFNKFAWNNTEYKDFIQCLAKQFNIKQFQLENWSKEWLDTKGHNLLTVTRKNSKEIVVKQSLLPHCSILKNFKINLSTWKDNVKSTRPIIITDKEETLLEAEGDAFLLNDEDHCFVQVDLDTESYDYFSKNITSIENSLTRTMIWTIFYTKAKNNSISFSQYVSLILQHIPNENNISVFQCVLEQVSELITYYVQYPHSFQQSIFNLTLSLLKQTTDPKKRKVILTCLLTTESPDILQSFLNDNLGDTTSQKIEIAQVLIRVVPDEYEAVLAVLEGLEDIAKHEVQMTSLRQNRRISKLNKQEKSEYLLGVLMSEESKLDRFEVKGRCLALRSDREWEQEIFQRFLVELAERIGNSGREEYYSILNKFFMKNVVGENELKRYRELLEKSHEKKKTIFGSVLLKLVEDHEGYIRSRDLENSRKQGEAKEKKE